MNRLLLKIAIIFSLLVVIANLFGCTDRKVSIVTYSIHYPDTTVIEKHYGYLRCEDVHVSVFEGTNRIEGVSNTSTLAPIRIINCENIK